MYLRALRLSFRLALLDPSESSGSSRVRCCVLLSGTLGGLFSQILQGEDIVRERAIKFLSAKLKTLPEDVLTKEVEDYIFVETKKVGILRGRATGTGVGICCWLFWMWLAIWPTGGCTLKRISCS